jgi:hypothetical protein
LARRGQPRRGGAGWRRQLGAAAGAAHRRPHPTNHPLRTLSEWPKVFHTCNPTFHLRWPWTLHYACCAATHTHKKAPGSDQFISSRGCAVCGCVWAVLTVGRPAPPGGAALSRADEACRRQGGIVGRPGYGQKPPQQMSHGHNPKSQRANLANHRRQRGAWNSG